MAEATFIPRHRGEPDDDSFESLRSQAIGRLQELAGNVWTDYNAHDPGVTLLEVVCYALTDLLYRADFPVVDLLTNERGVIDWEGQNLLPPEAAFPCRPTNGHDYRAVILDKVQEVENVWIDPVDNRAAKPSGLYRLRLKLSDDIEEPAEAASERKARPSHAQIKEKVDLVFAAARNLCEDLASIEIVPVVYHSLKAHIDLDEGSDPAETLAKIYFACRAWFTDGIEFTPYDRAVAAGKQPEEIFTGPFARSGLAGEGEIGPGRSFSAADIIAQIRKVDGIVAVSDVAPGDFTARGTEPLFVQLRWPRTEAEIEVQLFRGGRRIRVSLHDFTLRFKELDFTNRGSSFTPDTIGTILPRPRSDYRIVTEYQSAQYHLPALYGVGAGGVATAEGFRRETLARQLKGYLLMFDQPMADYLAMLGNLRHLFSAGSDKKCSYYAQPLDQDSFPGITEFYAKPTGDILNRLCASSRHADRATRLLDYQLALYGENFEDDLLPHDGSPVAARVAYLQDVEQLTRDRGAGADLSLPPGRRRYQSGLERKLSHLLGLTCEGALKDGKVRVVEHILLASRSGDGTVPAEPCFRISVLLSTGCYCGDDPRNFRKAVRDAVEASCPAHIHADIHWLDADDMSQFDSLYEDWWTASPAARRERLYGEGARDAGQTAESTARTLRDFLDRLRGQEGET